MIPAGEEIIDEEEEGGEEEGKKHIPESDIDRVIWSIMDFHDLQFSLINREDRPGGVHHEEDD